MDFQRNCGNQGRQLYGPVCDHRYFSHRRLRFRIESAMDCVKRAPFVMIVFLLSLGLSMCSSKAQESKPRNLDRHLFAAIDQREALSVEHLLRQGADIEARGQDGATPLMMAAESGQPAIVKLLLERGADIEATD